MPAKLIVESDADQSRQEIPFNKPTITIGRKAGNDLSFPRPEISGNHAAFSAEGESYFITDVGSTNGTLLNGAQLVAKQKYPLKTGDIVTITPFRITLEVEKDIMATMMEIPKQAPARKLSGTQPDLAGRITTGTAEQSKESIQQATQAAPPAPAAPPRAAAAPPPAPNLAPPAPAPPQAPPPAAPAPPPPAPPKPAAAPAQPAPSRPAPAPPAAKPAAQQPEMEYVPAASSSSDFLWLVIGGLVALIALAIIGYLLFMI